MQIDYDPEADAIYIRLRNGEVDHTIESSSIFMWMSMPITCRLAWKSCLLAADRARADMTSITFNIVAKAASDLMPVTPESQ